MNVVLFWNKALCGSSKWTRFEYVAYDKVQKCSSTADPQDCAISTKMQEVFNAFLPLHLVAFQSCFNSLTLAHHSGEFLSHL